MSAQRLVTAATAVLLMSLGAAPALAATVSIGGYYTVAYTPSQGNGPTFTDTPHSSYLGTFTGTETNSTSWNFTSLPTSEMDLFTANPNSCYSGSGRTCVTDDKTASGTITVTFHFTGSTATLTETGTYSAKYGGSALTGCTNSSSGDTDCIVWSGASDTPTGSAIESINVNGDLLNFTFYNAQDWSITPKIEEAGGAQLTPLPAALPLFAGGIGLFGLLARRRRRRISNV
jgi:hypothetical protein